MVVNAGVDGYTKTSHQPSWKIPENVRRWQPTKIQEWNTKTQIHVKWGPSFTFSWSGGSNHPSTARCSTV